MSTDDNDSDEVEILTTRRRFTQAAGMTAVPLSHGGGEPGFWDRLLGRDGDHAGVGEDLVIQHNGEVVERDINTLNFEGTSIKEITQPNDYDENVIRITLEGGSGSGGAFEDTDGDGVAELQDDHADFNGGDLRDAGAGTFGAGDGDGKEVFIPGDTIRFRGSNLTNTPLVAPQINGLGWTFQTDSDNEMRVQIRRNMDTNPALPALLGRFAHEGRGDLYTRMRGEAIDDTDGAHEGVLKLGAAYNGAIKDYKPLPSQANIYLSAAQTISATTFTKVNFDAKRFDYGPNFDSTNNELVVQEDGIYTATANITFAAMDDGAQHQVRIRVNGSDEAFSNQRAGGAGQQTAPASTGPVELTSGDTVSVQVYHDSAASVDLDTGKHVTFLGIS